jgi:hypothetical protein
VRVPRPVLRKAYKVRYEHRRGLVNVHAYGAVSEGLELRDRESGLTDDAAERAHRDLAVMRDDDGARFAEGLAKELDVAAVGGDRGKSRLL